MSYFTENGRARNKFSAVSGRAVAPRPTAAFRMKSKPAPRPLMAFRASGGYMPNLNF